jgi:hypothetical protein
MLATSVQSLSGLCSSTLGLIEEADFQDTVRHASTLFFFEWDNSSVLDGRAKTLNVYDVLSRRRGYEGKSSFSSRFIDFDLRGLPRIEM